MSIAKLALSTVAMNWTCNIPATWVLSSKNLFFEAQGL